MTSLDKKRLTALAGGAVLLVVAAALWFFLLSPQMSKADEVREETDAVVFRNDTMRTQIAAIREQEKNLPQQREYADSLAKRFPATADQAGMFEQIKAAAAAAGIPDRNVTAVTPSAPSSASPVAGDGAKTLPAAGSVTGTASFEIGITATGSERQIVRFLDALETMDRSYMITAVAYGPGGNNTYTLTLGGQMFALPAPVDPAEASVADPTAVPAPAPAPVNPETLPPAPENAPPTAE